MNKSYFIEFIGFLLNILGYVTILFYNILDFSSIYFFSKYIYIYIFLNILKQKHTFKKNSIHSIKRDDP